MFILPYKVYFNFEDFKRLKVFAPGSSTWFSSLEDSGILQAETLKELKKMAIDLVVERGWHKELAEELAELNKENIEDTGYKTVNFGSIYQVEEMFHVDLFHVDFSVKIEESKEFSDKVLSIKERILEKQLEDIETRARIIENNREIVKRRLSKIRK